MLEARSVEAQVDEAGADRLRVLVVGAGVAGVTLAQLLRRGGLHPVVVERAAHLNDAGYMLALMPLVDPVIDALGLRAAYHDRSADVGGGSYVMRSHRGAPIKRYSLGGLLDRYGDYRGISRGELVRLLGSNGGTASFDTVVTAVDQPDDGGPVGVTLRTGDTEVTAEFDLVVVADGLHSATRALLRPAPVMGRVDTGWGGWVVWEDPPEGAETIGEELWGAGLFVGVYPVRDQLGVLVAGPHTDTAAGPAGFVDLARRRLRHVDARLDAALTAVATADSPYYWTLVDCRADRWARGRTVLLGDAGAGFLPTAGIGACMAMESAWVLAEHLGPAAAEDVAGVLRSYERAQRPRVEAAQDNSRRLAGLMFHRSNALAAVRDVFIRLAPFQAALRPIRKLLATAPTTGAGSAGHPARHSAGVE